MLSVIPIGASVTIGGVIPAKVLGVSIGNGNAIEYRCVWWSGSERKTEWLQACEVDSESQTMPIGFIGALPDLADMGVQRISLNGRSEVVR